MKSQIDTFKQKSLLFLLATITKSFEKTKLGSPIMHYTSCLTPPHLITLASSKSFKLLINWFVFLNILPCKIGDKASSLVLFLIENPNPKIENPKITFFNPKEAKNWWFKKKKKRKWNVASVKRNDNEMKKYRKTERTWTSGGGTKFVERKA